MPRLYLIRHGENRANSLHMFSCKYVDFPLTSDGIRQARQTGAYLKGRGIDRIYSSPLRRAVETAEVIGDQLSIPVDVVRDLIEVDVGRLEGQAIDEQSRAFYYSLLEDWLDGRPEAAFPDGEDYASFYERAAAVFRRVVSANPGERVALVGHSGFFKAASKVLSPHVDRDLVLNHAFPNCAISEFEVVLQKGRLVGELLSWGRHGHLHGSAAQVTSD